MGFLKRNKQVDPQEVGRTLAEIGSAGSSELMEMLLEGLPHASRGDAYAVLASLTLLSCRRTLESSDFAFNSATTQAIYSGLITTLAIQRAKMLELSEDLDSSIQDIVDRANLLARIWNRNTNQEPSPHWYTAKEGWFMICGDRSRPDPARILALSGFFSATSVTVMEFLIETRDLVRNI